MILIDTYDKLAENISLKIDVMLMRCVIKDDSKLDPQIFLEKALFLKQACETTRWWDWCFPEVEKKKNRTNFY